MLALLHVLYAVGDRAWWGEFIAVWPPVGWLLVFTPAVVRTRSVSSAVLLVALIAMHGEWPRLGAGSSSPRSRLRVVTWNVAGDPASWAHLRALEPDLVLVQEHAGRPAPPWEGYAWHAGADAAALSRFPVEPLPSRKVGPWTDPLLLVATLGDGRRLLLANVRLVLPSVLIWAADGFRGDPRAGHEARVAQFSNLARLLDESAGPARARHTVLCGDFNSPATLPSLAPLRQRLADAWSAGGRGWPGTAPAVLPLARIDQCWASPDLAVATARVLRMPVSDHRLLLVDYDLP